LQGHKYAKRLQLEEKKRVHEMTGIMVLPRNIFITLKNRNDRSASIIKHMYKCSNIGDGDGAILHMLRKLNVVTFH
jgi:hypothetical protein